MASRIRRGASGSSSWAAAARTAGAAPTSLNSEVENSATLGVFRLALRPTSYDWRFVPIAGLPFTDAGSADCH